jgi:hypothetical protein
LLSALPATAASPAPTFAMSSVRGPVGTVVHLHSVSPCPPSFSAQGSVLYSTYSDAVFPQSFTPTVAPDGSWTAAFTADPSSAFGTTGPATVSVVCHGGGTTVEYASQTFDVTTSGDGYWLLGAQAMPQPCGLCMTTTDVYGYGDTSDYGPFPAPDWAAPIVAMAADPVTGTGYWITGADGGVGAFGDSAYHGSLPALGVAVHDIVGMAATPDGAGYWLVGADGGVFGFGNAAYHGSLPALGVAVHDIVGMAATPDGAGYWLVGGDGGVFAFGDARYLGSMGGQRLAAPVVGMAARATGAGYWLAAADGGVFAFGDATFHGSCSGCTTGQGGGGSPARFVGVAASPVTTAA